MTRYYLRNKISKLYRVFINQYWMDGGGGGGGGGGGEDSGWEETPE